MTIITRINMPLEAYNELYKKFEEVNKKLPKEQQLDFEKYKFSRKYGRLAYDLLCIELGIRNKLQEPDYYK